MSRSTSLENSIGLLFVVLLHVAGLWGLWQYELLPTRQDVATLFVNFIAPPAPERQPEPKRPEPPRPKRPEKPQVQQLVAEAPVLKPSEYVAPPPETRPVPPAPPAPMPVPVGPVAMSSELALACPERTPPVYPVQSRRLGETGRVILRVELNEQGQVSSARVDQSSGSTRLDDAALSAVKTWHCNPPLRNGQPAKATALQPFNFVLGN